ncbi:10960_t:CDS:2 [Ambispora leptoticha]|uniref:10960_t:CDS:1 n=1 Tax=Ambispora leptoticha TaxID=144679 RepID=A0A9N8VKL3_9GLOM|nr:10960_t:CDS:2 [Ambispora leptoticha]
MTAPLQNEKRKVIELAERLLKELRLEFTVSSTKEAPFSMRMEKLASVQDKEGIETAKKYFILTKTSFGAKETGKFKEITEKIKQLEQEKAKTNDFNKDKVIQLINELKPFCSGSSNREEFAEKIKQKHQELNKKIATILKEAKNETDPQKLTAFLKQINEASIGVEIKMEKKLQNELDNLTEKVLSFEPNPGKKIFDELNDNLNQNGLNIEDLEEETKEELESLENEEDKKEIIKKQQTLIREISIKGAKKKLEVLIEKIKVDLSKNLINQIRETKNAIVQFISENSYNQSAYFANQSAVDQFLEQAENKLSSLSEPEPM